MAGFSDSSSTCLIHLISDDEAEPTMEMYAAVDKKATKQTANTTTMDVYAAVDKKGTERKTTDSLAPKVFPTQGHVIDENKEKQKPKKTAGKGKKKGKGISQLWLQFSRIHTVKM